MLEVYELADREYAFAVFQFPRMSTFPATLIVWPYVVVTISSKVTATEVAAAQELVVVLVDVLDPVPVVVVVVVVLLPPEIGV